MRNRYTDKANLRKNREDFFNRQYGLPIKTLVIIFTIGFIFIAAIQHFIPGLNAFGVVVFSGIVIVALTLIMVFTMLRYQDIVMATEFQNTIFSCAARVNTEFCLILKQNGVIVYADPNFQKRFSVMATGSHGIDALLDSGGLSESDKIKLLDALQKGKSERLRFNSETDHFSMVIEPLSVTAPSEKKMLRLDVDMLSRPGNYSILRAVTVGSAVTQAANEANFDAMPVAIYMLNENGAFSYANDACCILLGLDKTNLKGMLRREVLHIDHEDGTAILLDRQKKRDTPFVHVTLPITDRFGVMEHYHILLTSGGSSVSLAHSPVNPWSMLEHSPIANVVLDKKGVIRRANKSFYHMLQQNNKNLEGASFIDMVSEQNRPSLKHLIEQNSQDNKRSIDIKPVDIQFGGEKNITVLLYMAPFDTAESQHSILCYLIDTTEQKNLELRFVHSQKMQAIGQLAGGIAHDFNNLLTAMIGFCDLLLLRHPAGDQSFADIMQIKQNANRAANLVRQLLAFSRKQTMQPEIIDITGVLDELSSLIGRLIGENINLNMQHGKDLKQVKVDQGQLEQVIINLAVNARDAMENNGALTIRTSNIHIDEGQVLDKNLIPPAEDEVIGPGDYVLIEVIDTGHGIPLDIVGKIFEPFFSTKEIGSGTGLGLSTVYGIVKQTGGFIYVTSKKNEGTTFSIFLKSYDSQGIKAVPVIEHHDKAQLVDLTGKGTVLLVEDESPVRLFSSHALTNKGYTVLEAESGDEALKIIKEKGNEIDVIVTDVIMPGMNGPAMIEQVIHEYPNIKVIFMSGYAEDAFIKSYGTERRFNFLPKPFTLKQLAGKVKEVLSES